MALPLSLILIATAAAALVAYGIHPDLAAYSSGLGTIMIARRLMWPLVAISLLCCIALIGLVIGGKRRAWWLIGLAPILALFVHRFGPGTPGPAGIVENPPFLLANDPAAPESGDYVVGLVFEGNAYAFPYRSLWDRPVVALTDYDKRMLLMWSVYANRAMAVAVTRDIRPRDLEVVSTPANSLLVYHRRLGQFICAVTGRLARGGDVVGFGKPLATEKTTWGEWRARHPDTRVMPPLSSSASPTRPILPQYKVRVPPMPEAATMVAMLATIPPSAIRDDVHLPKPANVRIGESSVLLVRDRAGRLRAFDRHLKEDLFLSFEPADDQLRRSGAAMKDVDTQSTWTLDGRAIDGPLKGSRLREIDVDDRLYWGVMKHWYPDLELIEP